MIRHVEWCDVTSCRVMLSSVSVVCTMSCTLCHTITSDKIEHTQVCQISIFLLFHMSKSAWWLRPSLHPWTKTFSPPPNLPVCALILYELKLLVISSNSPLTLLFSSSSWNLRDLRSRSHLSWRGSGQGPIIDDPVCTFVHSDGEYWWWDETE